jgi:hypothetical protein
VSNYGQLMSFWDQRSEVPAPGFHALLIGVSHYPFLSGGDQVPVPQLQRISASLKQLSGPAKTAADLALWLMNRRHRLVVPLRTCRLLVSSDVSEPEELQGLSPASLTGIHDALWGWHDDLNQDPDGVGLFYFAGHGIQKDRTDSFPSAL